MRQRFKNSNDKSLKKDYKQQCLKKKILKTTTTEVTKNKFRKMQLGSVALATG
jgi:hypothetical protein